MENWKSINTHKWDKHLQTGSNPGFIFIEIRILFSNPGLSSHPTRVLLDSESGFDLPVTRRLFLPWIRTSRNRRISIAFQYIRLGRMWRNRKLTEYYNGRHMTSATLNALRCAMCNRYGMIICLVPWSSPEYGKITWKKQNHVKLLFEVVERPGG